MCEKVLKSLSFVDQEEWACDIYIRAKKKLNYPSLGRRSAQNKLQLIAPLTAPSVKHPQVNASGRLPTHLLLTEKKTASCHECRRP